MYTINQIHRLQSDEKYFKSENEKYCLTSMHGKELSHKDAENQCNFCILAILSQYKKGFIDVSRANLLIDEVETFEYSMDLLGPKKVIDKINKEIISRELNTPYFEQLCVECADLYDFDE